MIFIDFQSVWNVYLSARPLLPGFPPPVDPQFVSGAMDIIDDFDIVIFDAYGVLHIGGDAFLPVLRSVRELERRKNHFFIVTNDVTGNPGSIAAKLCDKGYGFKPEQVISARSVLDKALQPYRGQKIGILASSGGDIQTVYPLFSLIQTGDNRAWDESDVVVFIDNNAWTHWEQAHWFWNRMRQSPRPLIVCNPDVGCPYLGSITAEPGFFSFQAALELGTSFQGLGKPYPEVYREVLLRFPHVVPDRMLMVGDSPHTDILGARAMGMKCLLVTSGLLAGENVLRRCEESGLWPDFIAAHP